MRWWREWRKPKLRCMRLGHRWATRWRRGFIDDIRIYEVEQERVVCRRCDEARGGWETIDRDHLASLTGPADMFRAMRREGGYWTEYGWRALGEEARDA